jgi:prephenate dehydratase
MRLAYLGPEGTFTHRAALGVPADERVACRSIRSVFESVRDGRSDAGVVPAENAVEGSVDETLDCLLAGGAVVAAERVLEIEHTLIGHPGAPPLRVYSHPQALAQCAAWLARNLPDSEQIACLSTSEAAAHAVGDPQGAAVAPAPRPGLALLASGLGPAGNHTRFYVISRDSSRPTGRDRSLVAFGAPHRPGALHACLAPFAASEVNLTRIESRPARDTAWAYHFVLEFDGHPEDAATRAALDELRTIATWVRLLGAWPRIDS